MESSTKPGTLTVWQIRTKPRKPPSNLTYKERYDLYLQSDAWRKKRDAVMERSQGMCEMCWSVPATEVHHLSYLNVFFEPLTDLAAVCRSCHKDVHSIEPQ
jgi:5-methylcytosine-specific restriction endonuclease McrA